MRLFALLFTTLLGLCMPAHALDPERREVIVVSSRAWDGHVYRETFVPSTHAEMSLMTGGDSAVTFVRTQEYYWPLSRRTYVDFQQQREELDGILRIVQAGSVLAEQPMSAYAIVYPDGAARGDGHLVWGEDAERAYVEYQEGERDFARLHSQARRAHTAYDRWLLEAAAARTRGESVPAMDPPPPLPEPSLKLVTRPLPGFRVSLDPGTYEIELVREGTVVEGTRRTLHVRDVAGRDVIVADIVPEERWTRPLTTNSEAARIFVRPGATFYMTLARATRFAEDEYLPVINPQANIAPGRDLWVRRGPAEDGRVALSWGEGGETALSLDRLKVEQTQGSGFGYRVREAREAETPELMAFTVAVPDTPSISRGHLRIEGASAASAQREAVIVHPRNTAWSLALALVPGIAGLGFAATRLISRNARRQGQD